MPASGSGRPIAGGAAATDERTETAALAPASRSATAAVGRTSRRGCAIAASGRMLGASGTVDEPSSSAVVGVGTEGVGIERDLASTGLGELVAAEPTVGPVTAASAGRNSAGFGAGEAATTTAAGVAATRSSRNAAAIE
jgi:hypothetical protein